MMGESDNDSWSVVDDADSLGDRSPKAPAVEHQVVEGNGRSESSDRAVAPEAEGALSGSRGNDSPPRPVVLEAVEASSPRPRWSFRAARDPCAQPRGSLLQSSSSPLEESNNGASVLSLPLPATSPSAEGAHTIEALPEIPQSPFVSSLPGDSPVSDSPFGSDDLEDNMSEASSDSHIIVTHPDEEDSAERRWRLAEQRGNDIRRAQSVPSPRVQGTSSYLKVMVVGERGLGKTTFIQNLHAALQPDAPGPAQLEQGGSSDAHALFKESPELLSTQVVIDNGGLRCHYLLQDTPGLVYGQTNIGIPDHVTAQNAAYLTLEQDPGRRIPMSAVKDPRVDACLFFINPNHLKDAEVAAMAHLAELVPIVPVIAKADIFTPSELEAFRQHVWQRLAEEEQRLGRPVMWTPHRGPEGSQQGPQPPFAVIASRQSDLSVGRFWPVRNYSWGRCETLSSANSDISLLKQLLFEEGFAGLKQGTEERYYRFRERQLRAQEEQAGAEAPEVATIAALPGSSSQARQKQSSRSRANRGAGGRGGYRKLWKWGLLLLTTVISTAYLGKVAENRQLQQDLTAVRDLADLKDQVVSGLASSLSIINKQHASQLQAAQAQLRSNLHSPAVKVADRLKAFIKTGLLPQPAELDDQCIADMQEGNHHSQVHQVDSTDLMLSTAASHTPNAPTPRYRVLIQDQTGGAQFQYVPPAAKAQPQFHRKLYDAKMSYAQDVPLHYRSHAAENNQAAQGLAHLPSDAGLELWDAAYPHRAQHAEFEPQPQDAESENQPHNWHMERVTVPETWGGGAYNAVKLEASGFWSTFHDIFYNLTVSEDGLEGLTGQALPALKNTIVTTATAEDLASTVAPGAIPGSQAAIAAVLPLTTAAKAAMATGTAAGSTGLVVLHSKAQQAGATLQSASTAVVAYTQQARSNLQSASTALATYTQHAALSMHRAAYQTGLALHSGILQSSVAVVHGLRQAQAAVAHARQSAVLAVSMFGGDVARTGHVIARETPLVVRRLQGDVSCAARSTADAARQAGSAFQHGVLHALHQVGDTAGHARKRVKHVFRECMGKFKRPKVSKTAQRFLRMVAQVGVLGAAL